MLSEKDPVFLLDAYRHIKPKMALSITFKVIVKMKETDNQNTQFTPPLCDAPDPFITKPDFDLPLGTIDCHAHVFGPLDKYDYTENRSYTPPDAPVGAYLHVHSQLSISHGVLVQPSVYGTDNSLQTDTLNYLSKLGKDYKGIAVVDANISDEELDKLALSGHVGVRMNLLFKGGIEWDDVCHLAERLAKRNWHLQFLIDIANFDGFADKIRQLPVPVVIDHMGHMDTSLGLDHPAFQDLLSLLEEGRVWVKLSGAYRTSTQACTPFSDVTPFAQALVNANTKQCVWGSDWPHPHFDKAMPNTTDLLNELVQWVPDESLRKQILVDNPKRLYLFD